MRSDLTHAFSTDDTESIWTPCRILPPALFEGPEDKKQMIDVSLIICTRNRSDALNKTLLALDRDLRALTTASHLEIIVVDNGSSDETQSVVSAFSPPCRVVRLKEDLPGLSVARNTGLDHAQGAIIAFTDDDCELSENYFNELIDNAKTMVGPFMIGGRVDLGDAADLPITIKPSPIEEELDAKLSPAGFIHGCNMAFSRELLDQIGRFDPRFGAGTALMSGEDTDFIIRAQLAGVRVKYFPNMVVRHYHGRRRSAEARKLAKQYEYGNGALLLKHGWRYPILVKNFWFNTKDIILEMLGRKARIGSETVPERVEIFKCHLMGAIRFVLS